MLTEADMIRIMAEKYCLAESLADAYIDNAARKIYDDDEYYEIHEYDIPYYDPKGVCSP